MLDIETTLKGPSVNLLGYKYEAQLTFLWDLSTMSRL